MIDIIKIIEILPFCFSQYFLSAKFWYSIELIRSNLAKIFYEQENDEEQEINLTNVLLLNPKNDEAIYMLVLLKIKQSDYNHAKELLDKFTLVCKSFCSKKNEMQDKFKKLTP